MSQLDEQRAVDEVCRRLVARFPEVSPGQVRATVDAVHARLTGPVRDYVPLLVERESGQILATLNSTGPTAAAS
jgi:hypothetical protein